ncbi:MAG: efflux RND transporter permease subunit [Alphaproteobacteria bacterium]
MIDSIIEFSARQWRATLFVLFFLMLGGAGAAMLVPKETNPDISIGAAYISLRAEGASGEDVADTIIKPLEDELLGVNVIERVNATAYDDGGNIAVECFPDVAPDTCAQEVRNAVQDGESNIAASAEAPTVIPINISDEFPVIVVSLFGNASPRDLKLAAEALQDEIENIPGVEEAELSGDLGIQTEIIISPTVFEDYGLSPGQVANQVVNANQSVGTPKSISDIGESAVIIDSGLETLKDVFDITLVAANDTEIRLGQVASIRQSFTEAETLAQVNGKPALTLVVKRKSGSNVRAIAQQTRTLVNGITGLDQWNQEIEVTFTQDSSILVNQMLSDLINAVAISILLVLVVIVAVLGLRTGLLVGIAIPGSMMIGILFLYAYGATMNIVTMFSLILASGMLVDGAIVVTEYADRQISKGMARLEAYVAAAKRMALPIISSTATTLVVFAPLLFWPGIVGDFMGYLPLTLIVTLTGSLLMAMIFVPILGEHLEKFLRVIFVIMLVVVPLTLSGSGPIAQILSATIMLLSLIFVPRIVAMTARDRFITDTPDEEESELSDFQGFTGLYARVLNGAVRTPIWTMGSAIVIIFIIFGASTPKTGFFPEVDPEQFIINVKERGNLSIEEKEERAEQVQQLVFDMQREYGEFANFRLVATGTNPGEDTIATIDVELTDWAVRVSTSGRAVADLEADLRQRISGLFTADVELTLPAAGPPTGKDLQLQLQSTTGDSASLTQAARIVGDKFKEMGLVDIDDKLTIPGFETHIKVDEVRAAERGVTKAEIGQYISLATRGLKVTSYRPIGSSEEIDIRLRYNENYRDLASAMAVNIITPSGAVPLSDLATLTYEPKAGIITRLDGTRTLTPQANIPPGTSRVVSEYVEELEEWVTSGAADLPSDVVAIFRGANEEQNEAFAFLGQAFVIALFVMFIILITQFNSFYHAVLILIAVFMSVGGVFLGLFLSGGTLDLMANIGIIALAGIVVNNNIVLIDTYQHLMRERKPKTYEERLQVIILTGAQRLRPVLLTTVTTILGLLPMAMGVNIDFTTGILTVGSPATQWWAGLAQAVVSGLTFATILTLIFTPAALSVPALIDRAFENRALRRAERDAILAPAAE